MSGQSGGGQSGGGLSGWDWFDRRAKRRTPAALSLQDAEEDRRRMEREEERLDAAYRATFGTPEGRLVLAHLRRMTLERVVAPGPGSDGALRHLEGQRHLVLAIERRLRAPEAAQGSESSEASE